MKNWFVVVSCRFSWFLPPDFTLVPVHRGSYLIAVLLFANWTAMAHEVVVNYIAVRILFLPAENCYRHMNLSYEYLKRYVVVKS